MDDRSPEMLKPTLTAGLLFGVLGGLPFVNVLNYCTCCSLVIACGFLASYLYSKSCRSQGVEFRPATGALVGLIAGAFYAVASTALASVFSALIGQPGERWFLEALQNIPNLPPEAADEFERKLQELEEQSFSLFGFILELLVSVLVAAVFSTVGGLIGGAVFRVPPPPPRSDAGAMPPLEEI